MEDIDMRMFAQRAGANVTFPAGSIVFNKGDPGSCMYIVHSGVIEMTIGEEVIEVCGPNEAIGFMSMIDGAPRSSTARVKEACAVHGRRGAEFCALHHGRDGAAHPRHEPGDVVGRRREFRRPSPAASRAPAIRATVRRPGNVRAQLGR